jgi:hypothetical protein
MVNESLDFSNSCMMAATSLEGPLQPDMSGVKTARTGHRAERGESGIC